MRIEDLKLPRQVDASVPLTYTLMVHCGRTNGEGTTKSRAAVVRAAYFVECRESVEVLLIPGDMDEVCDDVAVARVLIAANGLGEQAVVGCFAVPLSIAREGAVDFDVRCSKSGEATEHVIGRVSVEVVGDNGGAAAEATGQAEGATARGSDRDGGHGDEFASRLTPVRGGGAFVHGRRRGGVLNRRRCHARYAQQERRWERRAG